MVAEMPIKNNYTYLKISKFIYPKPLKGLIK
jgi:hypothetical protein